MKNKKYHVLGVMSGTSLDGVDLCDIEFMFDKVWTFKILNSKTVSYDRLWKERLSNSVSLESKEIAELDKDYTQHLATIISNFIKAHKITNLDAICSHGHTIFHQPDQGYTLQIGNLPILANLTNTKVICDFRVQDVKFGGQGAPLVPIGDKLLFHEYDFCVNLGGFANLSFNDQGERIAYDICPLNIALNHYVKSLGLEYDSEGKIAASGSINEALLNDLNALDFYSLKPPKSLGFEWVLSEVFPLIDQYQIETKDILRTLVEHSAMQIANALDSKRTAKVLFTGGGAYNSFLMDRISDLSNHKIEIPSNALIEFKEALVFGLLGVLKLRNEVNCLRSVTGASKDHSSGNIFIP